MTLLVVRPARNALFLLSFFVPLVCVSGVWVKKSSSAAAEEPAEDAEIALTTDPHPQSVAEQKAEASESKDAAVPDEPAASPPPAKQQYVYFWQDSPAAPPPPFQPSQSADLLAASASASATASDDFGLANMENQQDQSNVIAPGSFKRHELRLQGDNALKRLGLLGKGIIVPGGSASAARNAAAEAEKSPSKRKGKVMNKIQKTKTTSGAATLNSLRQTENKLVKSQDEEQRVDPCLASSASPSPTRSQCNPTVVEAGSRSPFDQMLSLPLGFEYYDPNTSAGGAAAFFPAPPNTSPSFWHTNTQPGQPPAPTWSPKAVAFSPTPSEKAEDEDAMKREDDNQQGAASRGPALPRKILELSKFLHQPGIVDEKVAEGANSSASKVLLEDKDHTDDNSPPAKIPVPENKSAEHDQPGGGATSSSIFGTTTMSTTDAENLNYPTSIDNPSQLQVRECRPTFAHLPATNQNASMRELVTTGNKPPTSTTQLSADAVPFDPTWSSACIDFEPGIIAMNDEGMLDFTSLPFAPEAIRETNLTAAKQLAGQNLAMSGDFPFSAWPTAAGASGGRALQADLSDMQQMYGVESSAGAPGAAPVDRVPPPPGIFVGNGAAGPVQNGTLAADNANSVPALTTVQQLYDMRQQHQEQHHTFDPTDPSYGGQLFADPISCTAEYWQQHDTNPNYLYAGFADQVVPAPYSTDTVDNSHAPMMPLTDAALAMHDCHNRFLQEQQPRPDQEGRGPAHDGRYSVLHNFQYHYQPNNRPVFTNRLMKKTNRPVFPKGASANENKAEIDRRLEQQGHFLTVVDPPPESGPAILSPEKPLPPNESPQGVVSPMEGDYLTEEGRRNAMERRIKGMKTKINEEHQGTSAEIEAPSHTQSKNDYMEVDEEEPTSYEEDTSEEAELQTNAKQHQAAHIASSAAGVQPQQGRRSLNLESELHANRMCKPCAFFFKQGAECSNGDDCPFCHLCPPGEKKQRKKERRAAAVLAARNRAPFIPNRRGVMSNQQQHGGQMQLQ
ncbi:unnamed protein product [Amoebophrya sp. A120]|nr:unnamed protein product [Amoebophrya sp. A120]|eukprot:GSA120T00018729001.1